MKWIQLSFFKTSAILSDTSVTTFPDSHIGKALRAGGST
jgi:hypothetical protein